MKKTFFSFMVPCTLAALVLLSCGGGGNDGGGNTAPAANAGPDRNVIAGSLVILDGSGSSDANGDPLTCSWSFTPPAGSTATLSGANTMNPSFTPDVAGTYTAQLIVNDGAVDSTPDTVTITASFAAEILVTGQTASYAVGDDGDLQKGVAWPDPRFTVASSGTGTVVTDNLTGLMWLQDANCIETNYASIDNDGTAGDGGVTWQHALDFVAGINAGTYPDCGAGHADWRLPNRNELLSLVHYGEANNAAWLNSRGYSNAFIRYWSSTTSADSASLTWVARITDGYLYPKLKSSTDTFVWPVRDAAISPAISPPRTGQTTSHAAGDDGDLRKGAAWPDQRFGANADATVTDRLTGLVWAPDGNLMPARDAGSDQDGTVNDGRVTWQHALDYVAKLNAENYLGHADWRLPNVNELASLVHAEYTNETTCGGPCATNRDWLNTQGFSNVNDFYYWSSSTRAAGTSAVWGFSMLDGTETISEKAGADDVSFLCVWPVRGGE